MNLDKATTAAEYHALLVKLRAQKRGKPTAGSKSASTKGVPPQ
jgi:hypothetical protein